MKSSNSSRSLGPRWVLGVGLAAAVAAVACGSDKGDSKGAGQKDGGGGGGGAPPAGPVEWSVIGFDLQSTFHNPRETKISVGNAGSLTELWSHEFTGELAGSKIGASGTSCVMGDKIYAVSNAGIYALDANTGDEVWKSKENLDVFMGATGSPACEDGVIYYLNGTGGYIFALDANNGGEIIWQNQIETHAAAAGWSSVVIVGDTLITGMSSGSEVSASADALRGSVIAVNKADGKVKWQTYTANETEDGASVWAAPSVDVANEIVYAPTGNNYTKGGPGSDAVFALDLETGAEKWRYQARAGDVFTTLKSNGNPDYDFGGNPVVYDYKGKKLVAAGQKSGILFVFDRLTGDVVAQRDMQGATAMPGGFFQALAFDGERLVGVCNAAKSDDPGSEAANGESRGGATSVLAAFDPEKLDILWERQLPAYVWGPVTIANGVGYVGIEMTMQAFNVADGAKLFEHKVAGTITSAVTVVDGKLYFQSGMNFFGSGHPDAHFHALGLP